MVPMAYQPKSSRSSIVSNINISCKIIIRQYLMLFKEVANESKIIVLHMVVKKKY